MVDFTEPERATVAELAGPYAELVSRINRRVRHGIGLPVARRIAGEEFGEAGSRAIEGSSPSNAAVSAEKPTR